MGKLCFDDVLFLLKTVFYIYKIALGHSIISPRCFLTKKEALNSRPLPSVILLHIMRAMYIIQLLYLPDYHDIIYCRAWIYTFRGMMGKL